MSEQTVLTSLNLVETNLFSLQSRIQGQVLSPADPQYQEARLGFNLSVDQHPALIVLAESTADVSNAVQFARQNGLGVAVQSTGHGVTLPADGALLLLTSCLKELHIDAQSHTARIGAGLQWGEVLAHAQAHGLAPLLGSSPHVGVVGYTLGGGYGWLGRKYGLATDSVLSFELVDAEGRVLRASQDENADLFWGLRGGGGSFGVITSMEIKLYPVTEVYGGNLFYPAEMARQVMQHYRAWIATAPDELTSSIVMINFPPIPQLPELLRGKSFVIVRGAYTGAMQDGEQLLRHWREWQAPLIDDFKAMPFSQVATISSDPVQPAPSRVTGAWLRDLSDDAIDTLIRYTLPHGGPPTLTVTEVRHVGGAVARVAPGTNAFGHRDAELLLFAVGRTPTPAAYEAMGVHTEAMKRELAPSMTGGLYMNFVEGPEARQKTRHGYTEETYLRLQALKAKVDPEDVFRFSYDIPPKKD